MKSATDNIYERSASDGRKVSSSDGSSRQTAGKQHAMDILAAALEARIPHEQSNGAVEEDSDSELGKRRRASPSQEPEDPEPDEREAAKLELDDVEYRRMRRRMTNRESAKRMRIKRQEELATFQKELKRVSQENEQLRKQSAYLQKQHIMMATDIQLWQSRYTTANAEVTAMFQQLQQLLAIVAVANPGILESGGCPAAAAPAPAPTPPQNPSLEALLQALPQARLFYGALEALRLGNTASTTAPLTALMASSPPAMANLPLNAPPVALNLAARLATAAKVEQEGNLAGCQGDVENRAETAFHNQELVQPKAVRAWSARANSASLCVESSPKLEARDKEVPDLTKHQRQQVSPYQLLRQWEVIPGLAATT